MTIDSQNLITFVNARMAEDARLLRGGDDRDGRHRTHGRKPQRALPIETSVGVKE